MKVPGSIRNLYSELRPLYEDLKEKVENRILKFKDPRWHYESRVKDLLSFALKLESGRVKDPRRLEDFLACTVVVENRSNRAQAEERITREFDLCERRPPKDTETHKASNAFPFDDLRLYLKWKDDPKYSPSGVQGLLFEIQVKTFLEHAWTIATHDLVYKADTVSWAKQRIAYQIKAMLEHAECAITEANELAQTEGLNKSDRRTRDIQAIIEMVNRSWQDSALPADRVRLAQNIYRLIRELRIEAAEFEKILAKETASGKGAGLLNLSPYASVTQALIDCVPEKMASLLKKEPRPKDFLVLLPREIDLPDDMPRQDLRRAIFVADVKE